MPKLHRVLAFASILLSACGSDQTAPDPIDLQPSGAAPVLAPSVSLERARPLPLSGENVGWCDLVVHRRDGGPSRHSPLRAPASRGNAASGQPRPLGRVQFARWEKETRRAVAEASCVVELDGRSARELRLAFALELDRALGQGPGNGQSSLRVFEGREGSIWTGEDVDCMLVMLYTIVLEMDCGGVSCGPMATLRMAGEGPVADSYFECDNGCTVDMDYLLYDCGNVGGDVDEGSGNTGGETSGEPGITDIDDGPNNPNACTATTCTLRDPTALELEAIMLMLPHLTNPERQALLDIVNGNRLKIYPDTLLGTDGKPIQADMHYDPQLQPDAVLHLWNPSLQGTLEGSFLILKDVLCHEALHVTRWPFAHQHQLFREGFGYCMAGEEI